MYVDCSWHGGYDESDPCNLTCKQQKIHNSLGSGDYCGEWGEECMTEGETCAYIEIKFSEDSVGKSLASLCINSEFCDTSIDKLENNENKGNIESIIRC